MSLYCSSHFVWKISILRGIKGIISTESKINKVFFFFFSLFLNFLAELRKAYRQTTQPDMTPLAGVKCDISLPSAETNLGRTGGIVNNTLSKLRNVFNCCFKLADVVSEQVSGHCLALYLQNSLKDTGPSRL